ncbi:hypothetical protein JVU11DRAFT_12894 [Chiua virens]|nr:hypothetical protein JVU11DRAFT_12894 [Chiua virens]
MGHVQSLQRSSGALDAFVAELGTDIVYEKSIGQARFLKTVRCRHRNGPLVVKIFIKHDPSVSLRAYHRKQKVDRDALQDIPNVYTYQAFVETEKAGYLIRQCIASNLYDRISTRPFLSLIEKKWIVYQLLTALSLAHLQKTPHGDIKSTNVLVSSSNWVYLTDFAPYKPTRLPLDDPSDFSFFYDTSGRRTCYVAPERFYKAEKEPRSLDPADPKDRVTESMDVFSAGCVIAEMFLEGAPLFSLSQLFKYREGEYTVDSQLAPIEDHGIRTMIQQMISLDPASRPSFDAALANARGHVLPECFYSFLHEYVASISERATTFPFPSSNSTTNAPAIPATPANTVKSREPSSNVGSAGEALPSESDHRIDRIWEDYASVHSHLLPPQQVERTVGDVKVNYDTIVPSSPNLQQDIFPVSLQIPSYTPSPCATPAEDGPALILLSLVLANIRNCSLPSSRIRALDILLALCPHLTDESKLDRAVPYVVELLRDEVVLVRVAAVRTLMQILMKVTVITPSNVSIFPEYIIPNVRYLVQDTEVSVRATYAQCIAPLADTALRYLEMGTASKAHGVAPGVNNDKQEYDEIHFEVSYDASLYDLHLSIQEQLAALLMDPSPIVKRAVLHNISALCIFLGRQRTNDVILSHMITYLNDRDWLLRQAFFDSIVDVAACAGGRSLEEYILPLMVQALSDVEESVVARVLSALTSLCELGLFQKMRIWELMSATLCFFYHPNVWIRQGATAFIASAANHLQPSDVWCILYPSLRYLLRCDVKEIDEQSLLAAMKAPLPRPVFDGSIQWAMKAERTMFWRSQRKPVIKVESPRESIVSMRKGGSNNVSKQNRTEEDEAQWSRLQNLGMSVADEAKLVAMRDYILKVANNASSFASRLRLEPDYEKIIRTTGDVELQKLSVVPRTVFLKSRSTTDLSRASRRSSDMLARFGTPWMSRATSTDHVPNTPAFDDLRRRLATINISGSSLNLAAAARERAGYAAAQPPSATSTLAPPNPSAGHDRPSSPTDSVLSTTNSSALRVPHRLQVGSTDGQKAAPAVGSSNTNAVGVLEAPSRIRLETSPERSGRSSPISTAGPTSMRQTLRPRVTSLQPMSTYDGQEVGINNLLDNLYLDNNRELQHDFGPRVHEGPIRRRNAARQSFIARDNGNRRVEATLVAHLHSHTDCVTELAVAPDHSFFVSASDDGSVKIWDTARLERSVTSKPRHTYTQHHARVKSLCIIEGVHCFASAAEDGSVHVVRVHLNQLGSLPKYGKLSVVREHRVESPGEYATCMSHFNTDTASNLVYATTHSVVVTLDLRTMRVLQRLENPRHLGSISCMCMDRKRTWILLGTSSGVLSLWDKRFGLLLKSWQVGRSGAGRTARIHQCVVHPTKGKGRWVMVAVETWKSNPEPTPSTLIEVWDIEKTVLVESFVTRTTASPSEAIPEPEEQAGVAAEQSPAAAIAALVNSRYPGGAAYANPGFPRRDRGSSQSMQRDGMLPAPSPDVRALVVGLDFGGYPGMYRSEIVDLSADVPSSSRNRGFIVSGSEDRRVRLWDVSRVERTSVLVSAETENERPSYSTVRSSSGAVTSYVETWVQSPSTANQNNRAPQRMSMITHHQQNLLKSHQDIITALACIDAPFRGGIVSGDRGGALKRHPHTMSSVASSSQPSEPLQNGPLTTAGDGKKQQSKEKKDKAQIATSQYPLELQPPPDYIDHRIRMFERLRTEYHAFVKAQPREEITITLPDGSERKGTSWETSPMDVAKAVSKGLSERAVIAKVDDVLWDLDRPLERSCKLEVLDFEHPEGKRVFWHSSAHVLGEAAERHYGCHLCIGPPTDDGFFYEMAIDKRVVTNADYPALEKVAENAVKDKQKFERLLVSKENLLEMFSYNKYKKYLIETKIPDGSSTTVYRCGPMVDLCVGPHIPHTGKIKAFMVTKNSASYFLGDAKNDSLQRVYGISFPDKKQMSDYKAFLAEAAKRDHRKIGREQELFFFNDLSPGSCFFLPHGTRIYNTLLDLMRSEYVKRGYQEVISPNIYHSKLWETSGHWKNYKDDMFLLDIEKEKWALKPMNCPGHCLIFDSRDRSYKELPIRMAEFGIVHRNEASGALTGLTRVRRFMQDDTHVFCMPSQIITEIEALFDFMQHVYGLFGFEFRMELSTRPENYLGTVETWDTAEAQLKEALDRQYPGQWNLNPGDGAFYGPKIDIHIKDALRRSFQCATIQLDFQLPERFNLKYRSAEEMTNPDKPPSRPVMIHRAILGSLERFIAIITEHFGGKWPFWLSPRQVLVIPVAVPYKEYAQEIADTLSALGLFADVDNGADTLPKKIRNGEIAQYNFLLVVGQEELDSRSVNVRNRDDVGTKAKGEMVPLDEVTAKLVALKQSRRIENKLV